MDYRKTVLLPQAIEKEAEQYLLDAGCELIKCSECTIEEVSEKIVDAEAIVLRTGIKISDSLIEKGSNLKTISRTGAGVDNVDLVSATKHGVIVTSSLGANTSSVVEHALTLMLSLSKNIINLDSAVRNDNFKLRYKNTPVDIQGKVVGFLGFGRIGSGLAEICHNAFGCRIVANDEYLPAEIKKEYSSWVEFKDLDSVISNSDFISIHVPLTDTTRNLINYTKMKMMKANAVIINTSRGGIINESDLVKALNENLIAGAGLDVFEKEPVQNDNPLLELENVILTPHTAALTRECVVLMAMEGAKRVVKFFEREVPENIANPDVLTG